MSLTDVQIRNAKPREKAFKLTDSGGLFVWITPNGAKSWRQKYHFEGKEGQLRFGAYPQVSLAEARRLREEAKTLLAKGINPGQAKKVAKLKQQQANADTFEVIARKWLALNKAGPKRQGWSHNHYIRNESRLVNNVFPWIGSLPISDIDRPLLLQTIRKVEGRGVIETARRIATLCNGVFEFAIDEGIVTHNPAAGLKRSLAMPAKRHHPTFTDPEKVAKLLKDFDKFTGTYPVQCALNLAPLVFCRPGELRQAKWSEINLEERSWSYHVNKGKGSDHIVPLSKQAITILEDIKKLTGDYEYVFYGARDRSKPMSSNAINVAIRRLGYCTKTEITGHGFRAMARTMLHERKKIDPHVIEKQLSHVVPDNLGEAYNRTQFIEDRIQTMQIWADYLDELKSSK